MSTPAVGALILAAGFSRRFGEADKRVADLNGRVLADVTVSLYSSLFDACRVVLRPDDDALAARLARFPTEIVTAADAHKGMGHTLAAGIEEVGWQWTFVALLDMPFVKADTLRTLIEVARAEHTATIIMPRYKARPEEPAHPVGFNAQLLEELARTSGDQGARHVVRAHQADTRIVALDDPGLVRDIDTPADLS